jgi:hypothetical protein
MARSLCPQVETPKPIKKLAVCAAEPVWKFLERKKPLVLLGIERRFIGRPACSLVTPVGLVFPSHQLHIPDTVNTTNLGLWAFHQSTARENTQYWWACTECQIDMLGTQTAFTNKEGANNETGPRTARSKGSELTVRNTRFTVSPK